jgi:hypothetical protein
MSYRDRDRDGEQEPPLPKPYEFVPMPDGRVPTSAPAGHHRYRSGNLSGRLTATIIARSPVHVASGLFEQVRDAKYPMVKGHFRTNGVPTIPGTSLKGCIRSIAEAISGSAIQVTRARDLDRRYLPGRSLDELDAAQRVFGTLGYQGMVRFSDAQQISGNIAIVPTPQLFRPRQEAVDTYFDGRRPRGRKFYMHGRLAEGNLPLEACALDSRFALRAEFENLTPGELGLVLTALGMGQPKLWPKLGGGKPACLGTIEVIEPSLVALDARAAYADFDTTPQTLSVEPLLEAARSERLLLDVQLQKIAEVLRWPREDRSCPDRSY